MRTIAISGVILCALLIGCNKPSPTVLNTGKLFTSLPHSYTGIDFTNQLEYDKEFNIYTYRNFYNGGGVALGDINNDGLVDIYLTANMKPNKLFLNRGNFRFEDITEKAGVGGQQAWSTGVSMADVNGDGFLDIYVCNSGDVKGDNRRNELFINNGDLTFSENAGAFGIADQGLSTHGVFFDYDHDGDLDLYVLNNSYRAIGSFNLQRNERTSRDSLGGDKLYRNMGDTFKDVSAEAGIYGSVIGFGLGVTVGDVNDDGWQDIYISNDFFERDYLYINKGDGTFHEALEEQIRCVSAASMGADMADINNDGRPDIFVTDMLPEAESRIKTKTTFDNWDRHQLYLNNGYYHQFTRNTLQLNNGNNTFSEIGRLAGVEATDWSWGALIADLDNDGWKDLFVANGIYQDLTDQDFLNFINNEETQRMVVSRKGVDFEKLISYIPSNAVANFAFHNEGGMRFTNVAKEWGLDTASFSNGSAYGDLDNDGDLDLVVNNVNMPLFVYRNESNTMLPQNHYLKVVLKGEGKNTFATGAKVFVRASGQVRYMEQMPMRGFESTMDPAPNFGLGNVSSVDTLEVRWPSGKTTILTNIRADQTITLDEENATDIGITAKAKPVYLFTDVTEKENIGFSHVENNFVDFDRDRLIYHMLSTDGPGICKGDVNNDGMEDFFIGNAKGSAGALFIQMKNGTFKRTNTDLFQQDAVSEDTGCVFFDADNDHDLDLYVASGGNEFPSSSTALIDRLYFNDGRGNFSKSKQLLPTTQFESTSCVKAADYDGDGDQDLFVGIRLLPFSYGTPVNGYILNNNGKGTFTDVTREVAPGLINIGMITDASWTDTDDDHDPDLVITGEWMPITVFKNEKGKFENVTVKAGLAKTNGWWNCLEAADIDHDGDMDFVAGNHGLNSRFRASPDKPITFYVNDFDGNGTAEQIISEYNGSRSYPLVLKHDLVMQLPALKKKYLKYESYKGQTMEDIFTVDQLEKSIKNSAYELQTSLIINNGDGTFTLKNLPLEAQFSPVFSVIIHDFDGDGVEDILAGGNFYRAKPEVGQYDASYGCFLKGDGHNNFISEPATRTGLVLNGEVRDMIILKKGRSNVVMVARNNASLQILTCK